MHSATEWATEKRWADRVVDGALSPIMGGAPFWEKRKMRATATAQIGHRAAIGIQLYHMAGAQSTGSDKRRPAGDVRNQGVRGYLSIWNTYMLRRRNTAA